MNSYMLYSRAVLLAEGLIEYRLLHDVTMMLNVILVHTLAIPIMQE